MTSIKEKQRRKRWQQLSGCLWISEHFTQSDVLETIPSAGNEEASFSTTSKPSLANVVCDSVRFGSLGGKQGPDTRGLLKLRFTVHHAYWKPLPF